MWTCPKCHHKFVNRNQWHSCGHYSVAGFLEGKSRKAIDLFNYFIQAYQKIGPVELHPVKTRVALLTKMRFCSVNKLGKDYIDVHLVFVEPYPDNSCFYRIENLSNKFFLHHFKIFSKRDINKELRKYMKMAYQIGNRQHVKPQKSKI